MATNSKRRARNRERKKRAKIRKLLAPYRRQMLETKALFDSLDLPEIPPSAPSIGRYKMYLADGKIAEGDLVSITLDGKVRRA